MDICFWVPNDQLSCAKPARQEDNIALARNKPTIQKDLQSNNLQFVRISLLLNCTTNKPLNTKATHSLPGSPCWQCCACSSTPPLGRIFTKHEADSVFRTSKESSPFVSFAVKHTKKQKENSHTPVHHVFQSEQSDVFTDHAQDRLDPTQDRLPFVKSVVQHQFSVPPTHNTCLACLGSRKRRQLELIVQRCCSTEHALHYNNCRLNVSETNAFQKTCLNTLHSAWNVSERESASRMSNDRKRRLDVDGSGSGSKKHR